MSRATIAQRIRAFEEILNPANRRRSHGIIALPAMVTESEWIFQVAIHHADEAAIPCPQCGLPCANVDDCRHPQPPGPRTLKPVERRRFGCVHFDGVLTLQDGLYATQRRWCEQYGVGGHCEQCRYPLAMIQRKCLVCVADALIVDTPDDVIASHRWYINCTKERHESREVHDGSN